MIATDCCDDCTAAASFAGFFCGNRHDFIVAQQSHCTVGVGILMPHICAGACAAIAASAITSKTLMVNRLNTLNS